MKTIAIAPILALITILTLTTIASISRAEAGPYRIDWYVTEVLKSRAPFESIERMVSTLKLAATDPTPANIRLVQHKAGMTKLLMELFRGELAYGGIEDHEAGSYGNATVIIASLSGYSILCDEVLGGSSDKSEFVSEAGIIHSLRDKLVKTEYGRLAAHARE